VLSGLGGIGVDADPMAPASRDILASFRGSILGSTVYSRGVRQAWKGL